MKIRTYNSNKKFKYSNNLGQNTARKNDKKIHEEIKKFYIKRF